MTDQFIGKVLAEKYQIDSLISKGSLGNLYHGTHLLMEKSVAVKVLSPTLAVDENIVKNFSNEARTVSRISHPNILNVTDYGSDQDKSVFIIYEEANGETLKEIINRNGKLSLRRANDIVREIAAALSTAHANGVVHQNLSSENILVGNTFENVKVLNFGTNTFDINDLDYPVEKIQYLAPEQCTITGKIDNRTDIYSLGVILFEMLTGKVPFTDDNGTDLMIKQAQDPPPPITAFRNDLPDEVDEILLTALAKNPEIRYQTVDEFANTLNQVSLLVSDYGEEETVVSQRFAPNNAVPVKETPQNNLWKTAFIVLAGVVLLGGTFIVLTDSKKTNPSTQLQSDANGSPVQPAPPPTGSMEQTLANMDSYNPNAYGTNSNTGIPLDGGGTYNPYWDKGGRPPGAPPVTGYGDPYPVQQVAPGGQQVYIDPGNGSIFMPQDDGSYVVMAPKPANTASNANTAPKKNANTNTSVTTPPANTTVKPSPTPATTPASKVTPTPAPTTKPKTNTPTETKKPESGKPAATEKRQISGKEQDTF